MPPALQTTSRSQYAPNFFWMAERYLKCPSAASPRTARKEIPCVCNQAAARVADAGAESIRQLGCRRSFELRFIFRRLAAVHFFLPKILARLPISGLPNR